MKKYLGIILSALMAISFLQGCSDDDSDKYGFIEIGERLEPMFTWWDWGE
ncbi:MAG: hypothetical protein HN342_14865 [Nitrospina sp.]|nr:hypothetical protein [Nitrospina sp.]